MATYQGKSASELINKEIINGTSLAYNIFEIRENAKGRYTIRTFDVGADALQGSMCDFSPAGGDFAAKTVDLTPTNINLQFCKDDMNIDWQAFDMQPGADGAFTPEATRTISEAILQRVAVAIDKDIWSNIKTEAAADADVIDVTLLPLTPSNILDEVGKVYAELAAIEDFDPSDAVIVMSTTSKAMLEQAYAEAGTNMLYYLDEKATNYLGIRIVGVVGMFNDEIFGSFKSNLFYLTDSDNDRNSVSVKDMGEVDLSNNIRFKAHFWNAATYAFGEKVVYGHV